MIHREHSGLEFEKKYSSWIEKKIHESTVQVKIPIYDVIFFQIGDGKVINEFGNVSKTIDFNPLCTAVCHITIRHHQEGEIRNQATKNL